MVPGDSHAVPFVVHDGFLLRICNILPRIKELAWGLQAPFQNVLKYHVESVSLACSDPQGVFPIA